MSLRVRSTIAALLLIAAPHAWAGQKWGDFKDNGCVNPEYAPGMRSYSAILWGIPNGYSWEQACATMPGTVGGHGFKHPAVCVNVESLNLYGVSAGIIAAWVALGAVSVALLAAGDGSVLEEFISASPDTVEGVVGLIEAANQEEARVGLLTAQRAIIRPWPLPAGGPPLFGAAPPGTDWKKAVNAALAARPVKQIRKGNGGLNMWGVFFAADDRCLPPAYHRKANFNWAASAKYCSDRGMKLCTQAQICRGGAPVMGTPAADVWLAAGDAPNRWVAIGTKFPDRVCKTHEQVAGKAPDWGLDRGPQPFTQEQTAFRCCP
ncbi:MAG: hypothetical protein KC549_12215 [Myxococcales bacterium]|nr:hypothetical protein [Myxococcales bacterium]MCB9547354.1 hypothetical protein [Myxococcales bacterium]